jgi:magnesium transporter
MLVDAAHYHEGSCTARGLSHDAALAVHQERPGFVWLSFVDATQAELAGLRDTFGLHELAGEDMLLRHERPTFEVYDGDRYLVVLRTARYDPEQRTAQFGELAVFLGETFVVSSRRGGAHAQGTARANLQARPDLLSHGVSAVLWAIVAKVVSDIRPVVDALDEDLVELESLIFSDAVADHTRRIFALRFQTGQLYRAVHPMLAPLDAIQHGAYERLGPMRPYLREVSDEAKTLHEDILGLRDRLTGVLEANLALMTHRQNESVRKIAGWGAVIAVPTLIAGVFGMNFSDIPGLRDSGAFGACLAVMLAVSVALWVLLRRAEWV